MYIPLVHVWCSTRAFLQDWISVAGQMAVILTVLCKIRLFRFLLFRTLMLCSAGVRAVNLEDNEPRYERNAYYFFSETIITVIIKPRYMMGTSFTKSRLFFPPLREMLCASHVKSLLTQRSSSRTLHFSSSSSAKRRLRSASVRGSKG